MAMRARLASILLSKDCENASIRRSLLSRVCDVALRCRFDGSAAFALIGHSGFRSKLDAKSIEISALTSWEAIALPGNWTSRDVGQITARQAAKGHPPRLGRTAFSARRSKQKGDEEGRDSEDQGEVPHGMMARFPDHGIQSRATGYGRIERGSVSPISRFPGSVAGDLEN